jgi:GTPase SAR1 family protein
MSFYLTAFLSSNVASSHSLLDIRDLISLEDVMEELQLGPNGGLVYCFECVITWPLRKRIHFLMLTSRLFRYLLKNLDWLQENLNSYEDDFLIIDCPGQIELYTHFNIMQKIVQVLTMEFDFRLCAVSIYHSNLLPERRSAKKKKKKLDS